MNNQRRKSIRHTIGMLEEIKELAPQVQKFIKACDDVRRYIGEDLAEEELARDNIPESMMFTQRYEDICDAADELTDADATMTMVYSEINDMLKNCEINVEYITDTIDEVIESLNNAMS